MKVVRLKWLSFGIRRIVMEWHFLHWQLRTCRWRSSAPHNPRSAGPKRSYKKLIHFFRRQYSFFFVRVLSQSDAWPLTAKYGKKLTRRDGLELLASALWSLLQLYVPSAVLWPPEWLQFAPWWYRERCLWHSTGLRFGWPCGQVW